MRMAQEMGLSIEAKTFLEENGTKVGVRPCPHCGGHTEHRLQKEQHGTYSMWYEDEWPLFKYPLKDGGYAMEKEQCCPWSSGPMQFLKLEIFDQTNNLIRSIEWDDETIEAMQ